MPRQPAAAADVQRSYRRRPALHRLGIGKFNAAMAEIGTVLAFMFYLCTYIDSRLVESELYPAPLRRPGGSNRSPASRRTASVAWTLAVA